MARMPRSRQQETFIRISISRTLPQMTAVGRILSTVVGYGARPCRNASARAGTSTGGRSGRLGCSCRGSGLGGRGSGSRAGAHVVFDVVIAVVRGARSAVVISPRCFSSCLHRARVIQVVLRRFNRAESRVGSTNERVRVGFIRSNFLCSRDQV